MNDINDVKYGSGRFDDLPFVDSIGTVYHEHDREVLASLTEEQWTTVHQLIHAGISHGRDFYMALLDEEQ